MLNLAIERAYRLSRVASITFVIIAATWSNRSVHLAHLAYLAHFDETNINNEKTLLLTCSHEIKQNRAMPLSCSMSYHSMKPRSVSTWSSSWLVLAGLSAHTITINIAGSICIHSIQWASLGSLETEKESWLCCFVFEFFLSLSLCRLESKWWCCLICFWCNPLFRLGSKARECVWIFHFGQLLSKRNCCLWSNCGPFNSLSLSTLLRH